MKAPIQLNPTSIPVRESIRYVFANKHSLKRYGATLSEVLISLLVMSVGVVALATLFPISVLRSLQATQLTSAANLRYNAESLLGVSPRFYTIGSQWERSRSYAVGDLVTPTGCCTASLVLHCQTAGTSGTTEPTWNTTDGATTTDAGVTWRTYRLQNYVVDPLGKHLVEPSYRQTANKGDFFGYDVSTSAPRQVIRAFAGNVSYGQDPARPETGFFQNLALNEELAAHYATLPDSWIEQAESTQITYTPGSTSCTLNDLPYDLTSTTPIATPPAPLPSDAYSSRVVFFNDSGRTSHVRPLNGISGTAPTQTLTWPSAIGSGPLPTGFVPSRARIETRERRYTWLLSVRRDGDSFQMEVVVFFRRPFSGKDEQVYPATFTAITDPGYDEKPGVANSDDDGKNGTDDLGELGYVGSDDVSRSWVVVQYDGTNDKPFVKKGGYVTDADNLRWYRILDVFEGTTPTNSMTKGGLNRTGTIYPPDLPAFGANTRSLLLKLEHHIVESGPQPSKDASGNPTSPPTGRAILLRNIVDVYPIRTRVIGESF